MKREEYTRVTGMTSAAMASVLEDTFGDRWEGSRFIIDSTLTDGTTAVWLKDAYLTLKGGGFETKIAYNDITGYYVSIRENHTAIMLQMDFANSRAIIWG